MNHAIVTGGSSGIGLALVRRLRDTGAAVSVIALDDGMPALEPWPEVCRLPANVTSAQDVRNAVAKAIRTHGPVDLLVTCAGVVRPGRFLELPEDEFTREMNVNYFGTLNAVRAAVPGMIERRTGAIVTVASFAGLLGVYGYSAYAPSKYAVRGLSETLRTELKPHRIYVGCAFPTDVETPMLADEEHHKPPETRALSEGTTVLTADAVARAVLRGVQKRTPRILIGASSRVNARVIELFPDLTRRIIDRTVRKAQRP